MHATHRMGRYFKNIPMLTQIHLRPDKSNDQAMYQKRNMFGIRALVPMSPKHERVCNNVCGKGTTK